MLAMLAACGMPGAPQLPSLNLARPVEDLTASRKGNQVQLDWTLPKKNTDRTLVQLKRLGPTLICRRQGRNLMASCTEVGSVMPPKGPDKKVQADEPIHMKFVDTLPPKIEDQDPAGMLMYAVETMNTRNRSAGLSNQVMIPAAPTTAPPQGLRAEVTADGVRLSWEYTAPLVAPAGLSYQYRIERKLASASGYIVLNDVDPAADNSYLDKSSDWQQTYDYRVSTVTRVHSNGINAEVEGADSAPVEIFTKDIYPPARPTGLQAVFSSVGQKPFVDLTWAPNMESDLAGYNVFRRTQGGPVQKLNQQLVPVPSFRDETATPGKTYIYSVSAVDQRGNESPRSQEASEAAAATQ